MYDKYVSIAQAKNSDGHKISFAAYTEKKCEHLEKFPGKLTVKQ